MKEQTPGASKVEQPVALVAEQPVEDLKSLTPEERQELMGLVEEHSEAFKNLYELQYEDKEFESLNEMLQQKADEVMAKIRAAKGEEKTDEIEQIISGIRDQHENSLEERVSAMQEAMANDPRLKGSLFVLKDRPYHAALRELADLMSDKNPLMKKLLPKIKQQDQARALLQGIENHPKYGKLVSSTTKYDLIKNAGE